jgi:hypothetical protein
MVLTILGCLFGKEKVLKFSVLASTYFYEKSFLIIPSVAKFLVPDWEDKVNCHIGLSYQPAMSYICSRVGTTTLCLSQLHPHLRDYEFGFRKLVLQKRNY